MRKIAAVILSFVIVFGFAGCTRQNFTVNAYENASDYNNVPSGVVKDNGKYSLVWDKKNACVSILDNENQIYWNTIPDNASDNTTQPQVFSAISVSYVESKTLNTKQVHSNKSVKRKTYSSEKTENGIKVTFYFDDINVSVPVEYVLRKDSFAVIIDPNEIKENTELVSEVSVAPFSCSVLNTASRKDNYLFTPDGSGALIYPKTTGSGITSLITQQMYGSDGMIDEYPATKTQDIRLPVYGAKNGDKAILSIIESSADTAELSVNVGSETYGYSSIYSSFNIRGLQTVETEAVLKQTSTKKSMFCKGKTTEKITVGFYPLQGEKADYVGMADCYRNYLISEKKLKKSNSDSILNLKFIGGVQRTVNTLGIPHKSLYVATNFKEVNDITNDLIKNTGVNANVDLIGFGKSGANIGKIAGGYGYASGFGSVKSIKELSNNKNVSVFFNFDVIRLGKGGNGVSMFNGTAISALGMKNSRYYAKLAFPDSYLTDDSYYFVKRSKLNEICRKATNAAEKWEIEGVSFDTLSSMSYSDYSVSKYYAKSDFEKQATEIITSVKQNGNKFAAFGANAYSAVLADHIYDAPVSSSKYQVYDCDVPFFQMVFKGYVSMSVPSLNFETDYNSAFLRAVETGSGLAYTLISNYDGDLKEARDNVFYSSLYGDNRESILSDIERYKSLFETVKNTEITEHTNITDTLHCTAYANGIKVYVNYGNEDCETDGAVVKANDFTVRGERQ